MKDINLLELLKSGAHFGHSTSKWNPKMKPYIFTSRGGIHILDLEKTKSSLVKAAEFAKSLSAKGGIILFVGTKKQTREIVKQAAISCEMPYVDIRWMGGTFTNFRTIQKTIRKLEKLEDLRSSGEIERYTKKERLMIEREIEKLKKLFEGIKHLKRIPDAIFITDTKHDNIAVTEAKKAKVKIIALVDSNCNPEALDYVIPCNDDATKAIELLSKAMAEAINEGKQGLPAAVKMETKQADSL
ncbi:MAG: 30S ribosomal protein S2 [Candidatus Doudnabacteria bacterium]|nr:30S ribosomal protein S2 [Candidatus Doudnabacteria bacterium]